MYCTQIYRIIHLFLGNFDLRICGKYRAMSKPHKSSTYAQWARVDLHVTYGGADPSCDSFAP